MDIKPLPARFRYTISRQFHAAEQGLDSQVKMAEAVPEVRQNPHIEQTTSVIPGKGPGLGDAAFGQGQQATPDSGRRTSLQQDTLAITQQQ